MGRIARWLVGYRDDLDLPSKWWHRLAKVVFFLLVAAITLAWGGFVFNDTYHAETQVGWPAGQVSVTTDLESFTVQHPEMANAVSAFRLIESVGVRDVSGVKGRDGRIKRMTLSESDAFCNSKLSEHRADLAKFLGAAGMSPTEASYWAYGELEHLRHAPLHVPVSAVVRGSTYGPLWLLKAPDDFDEFDLFMAQLDGHKFPLLNGHCVATTALPHPGSIVAFEVPPGRLLLRWATAAGYAASVPALLSIFVLTAYYRGLIYVLYGKRPSVVGSAPSQCATRATDE